MSTVKRSIFSLFLLLTLVAAQCNAQSPGPTAQPGQEAMVGSAANGRDQAHQYDERSTPFEDLAPVSLDAGAGEKLRVVATTNIVGDIVRQVAGEAIELTIMLPAGADPHTFAPSPRDVTTVADAHLIFTNGLGLETFLAALIENAGGEAVVIPVSEGVARRGLDEPEDQDHDHLDAGDLSGSDPHTWMTPTNAIVFVDNIEGALRALDPSNAATYRVNAEAYIAELEALDAWVEAQIATIPAKNRRLVTDHQGLGYYVGRYGLELVGAVIPAYSTNAEPSAQELSELQAAINNLDVEAIFVGTTVNPRLAEQVAQDNGIQFVSLYIGSLGEAGSGAETYLDLIRYNTTAIVNALK